MGAQNSQNLPAAAANYLASVTAGSGVAAIAFAPGGGWVIVSRDGEYMAPGTPPEFQTNLQTVTQRGQTIRSIAFRPDVAGGWVIVTDQGVPNLGLTPDCAQTIDDFLNHGSRITCVAFPARGGDSWLVLADDNLEAHNIDDWCYQTLCNFTQTAQRATGVAFAPGDGWSIFGCGGWFGINIGDCLLVPRAYVKAVVIGHCPRLLHSWVGHGRGGGTGWCVRGRPGLLRHSARVGSGSAT
jgi:WD40 repeat protein